MTEMLKLATKKRYESNKYIDGVADSGRNFDDDFRCSTSDDIGSIISLMRIFSKIS